MASVSAPAVKKAETTKKAPPTKVTKPAPKQAPKPVGKTVEAKTAPKIQAKSKSELTAQAAPMFKIERAAHKRRWLKILVYADYGVGKTFFAGTAVGVEEMNDVLLIDAEGGDLTLESEEFPFENIDRVTVKNFRQVSKVHEFLRDHMLLRDSKDPEAEDKLRKLESQFTGVPVDDIDEPRRYRTVIIDPIKEVEAYCMDGILGITTRTTLDEDVGVSEWPEYKKNRNKMKRLVRQFKNLPAHLILTCPAVFMQDEAKKRIWMPEMTGKLSGDIQQFMDIVGFMQLQPLKEGQKVPDRRMFVSPAGKWQAKCRFSSYKAPYFDNPTVGGILKKVGLTRLNKQAETKPKTQGAKEDGTSEES